MKQSGVRARASYRAGNQVREREGANGVGGGIGLAGGIVHGNAVGGDNGDMNGDGGGT